jgi:hypothetical protein
MRFLFQSEDQVRFFADRIEELVPEPFHIFRDIPIPMGRYRENRAGAEISTKPGRSLSSTLTVSHGGFFGGRRFEVSPSLLWKLNKHFTLLQVLGSNFIELDDESLHFYVTRTRIAYSLDTSFSVSALLQYDNSSQEFGINFRAGYLFKEGTELFVVYNEILERQSSNFQPNQTERSLLIKFTYLLQI